MEWDWGLTEAIAKTLGTAVGIGAAGYQAYQLGIRGFRSRVALKRDLEILKMLDPSDPSHAVVKAHIDRIVGQIYTPSITRGKDAKIWRPQKLGDFILGVVTLIGFSFWTAYLDRDGFNAWSILTGLFAFGGLAGVLDSYGLLKDGPSKKPPDAAGK